MGNLALNLLDRERRARLDELAQARMIAGLSTWLLVIALLTTGGLIGCNLYLESRLDQEQTQLATVKRTARGGALSLIESTERFNQQLSAVSPIAADPAVDQLLIVLSQSLPSGVRLTALSVSVTNREISLSAVAATRNAIPELEGSLKSIPALSDVALRSNLNERTNVNVSANAVFSPETLNQQ
ncbi:MAG: hypothetical protein HY421_01720 [Candidatus Kerfeldbacteria bacterium]|nr:hypothetical protein [Candidatus Kerfeldbacteria bacterium]